MDLLEQKQLPHLLIKKVHKSSHEHMEEFLKQFGNVDSIYYARSDGDYPFMFAVFTKESSLNRAYVRICEKFNSLYEVSLKPLQQKTPNYCIECMKESYYFCQSCSESYCSEACQRKDWPKHAHKCVSIPKLVQVPWNEPEALNRQVNVDVGDVVVIVGYQQPNNSVTVRVVSGNRSRHYQEFMNECTEDAKKSPQVLTAVKEDKVWALHRDQWYRAKVESVIGDKITCQLLDLNMSLVIAKENLRKLLAKELFLRPTLTKTYRMKLLRQKDAMAIGPVRNHLDQVIQKGQKFSVIDLANNHIDLQYDGDVKSFNRFLMLVYDRHTGADEPEPVAEETVVVAATETSTGGVKVESPAKGFTVANISFPKYAESIKKPDLFVFQATCEIDQYVVKGFDLKFINDVRLLTEQISITGKTLFDSTNPLKSFDSDLDLCQLCLVRIVGADKTQYERCMYSRDSCFESIDTGKIYEDVKLQDVRSLPRELLSKSYLMTLFVEQDQVDQHPDLQEMLSTVKFQRVSIIEELLHIGENNFSVVWKK